MSLFCCPVCGALLRDAGKSCVCPEKHSYDKAKSGYLNLLLPSGKHSQNPGDDKRMVDARRNFLEKGYYQPFLDEICRLAEKEVDGISAPVLLDIGCGEGYYTKGVFDRLEARGVKVQAAGIDISKIAVQKAAKAVPQAEFAVASAFHLPVAENSCDLVMNLFAPLCEEEVHRVLKPDGVFLLGIPDAGHLWELKEAVYDQPYQNEVKDPALPGFRLTGDVPVQMELSIENPEDLQNLFQMTPYYYKTSRRDQERLEALQKLCVRAQFRILVYRAQKLGEKR